MHVCTFASTFAELVKQSRSDGAGGSLPVFVLPGGRSLTCSLSLSYTLETLPTVHNTWP